jgi:hypothetical protein
MEGDRNEGRLISGDDLHVDDRSLGEGCQPDGIAVYGGYCNREIFPTVTRERVPNPNQNWNSLANRLRAFHIFLDYCRQYEFWDVHFSQCSYKQLQANEKNKATKYSDAFRTFINREDEEFAHARINMRYLNSRGALSDGAMKVIDNLAMIKYPTPPTEDNPCGTLSYLPARAQWAELHILKIQRTMVDTGAIPLKSGIAVCSANAPRQLPTAHAVEAGEAGPSAVFRKYLDGRPLSNNSGHCSETHTGSHLEVEETDSPDKLYLIPQLPILLLFFMRAPSPLQQIQATVWKLMQDLSWKMLVQLRHPLWLK